MLSIPARDALVGHSPVLRSIAAGAPLDEILHSLVVSAEELNPGLLGSVLLVDAERRLRHGAAPSLPDFYNEAIDGVEIGPEVGSCGAAAALGERVIVEDVLDHPNWVDFRDVAHRAGLRACWSHPILDSGGEVLGTFAMYYSEPRGPEPHELEFIETAAYLAGIAIEHDRTQAALRASERLTRRIIDLVPHMIFAKDRDGRFLLANRPVAKAYGRPVDSVVGRTLRELPGHRAEVEAMLADDIAVMESGKRKFGTETFTDRRGRRRVLQTTKIPFTDPESDEPALLGIAQDITDRLNAEDERRRLEQRMQQAQRLEGLGLLAGGVAHDFNNLLTGILANASIALRAAGPDGPARPELDEIVQGARVAASLTEQLLAYAGMGRFEPAPLDLSAEVHRIQGLLKTSVGRRASLALDLASGLPPIDADRSQIHQVVLNLVTNAAESRRGEVQVSIRTAQSDLPPGDLGRLVPGSRLGAGRHVALEVRDDGPGIPAGALARIFDPFFTTKETGRGLGLAATLGIVHGHGGAIAVESSRDGTLFRAYFPAASGEPVAAAQPQRVEARERGVVLAVDDDRYVLDALRRSLVALGYVCITAESGARAIEIFAGRAREIDLVLLDMTMPEMDGIETFERLREVRPDVPGLLTTGYRGEDAARRVAAAGLVGILRKPYCLDDLERRLAQIVDRRPDTRRRALDLDDLRADYAAQLPRKLDELADTLARARRSGEAGEELARALFDAHRLKGSSGTYRFLEVSEALQEIEDRLRHLVDSEQPGNDADWQQIEAHLTTARAQAPGRS